MLRCPLHPCIMNKSCFRFGVHNANAGAIIEKFNNSPCFIVTSDFQSSNLLRRPFHADVLCTEYGYEKIDDAEPSEMNDQAHAQ